MASGRFRIAVGKMVGGKCKTRLLVRRAGAKMAFNFRGRNTGGKGEKKKVKKDGKNSRI